MRSGIYIGGTMVQLPRSQADNEHARTVVSHGRPGSFRDKEDWWGD